MEKRFKVLRLIGTLYKILGGLVAVITLLGVLAICLTSLLSGPLFEMLARQSFYGPALRGMGLYGAAVPGVFFSLLSLLYGTVVAISLYAFGEAIYLLLALEENTRATVSLLQRQSQAQPGELP